MTAARMLVRHMFGRPAGGPSVPEPFVAMLGPRGAGKSTALREVSRACGGAIVHALLDFADPNLVEPDRADPDRADPNRAGPAGVDPVAAVAFVVFELMRSWPNLPRDPTFHRVGLSLLALNERLPEDHTAARARIEDLVRNYWQSTQEGRRAAKVRNAVESSAALAMDLSGIATAPHGNLVRAGYTLAKPVIGRLFELRGKLVLRRPAHWLRDLFEDASLIDALISLSHRGRDPLDHLMSALLADLADNAARTTTPVVKCECLLPPDRPHRHAWALLVDHAGGDSATRFLTALIRARQRRSALIDGVAAGTVDGTPPAHDPLLVLVAVDRWATAWSHWWREPWQTAPESTERQRIPLLSQARMDQWVRHIHADADTASNPDHAWYPVWLDPLPADRVPALAAAPTGWPDKNAFHEFVRRLSGELPVAVRDIGQWYLERPSAHDTRAVFTVGPDDEKALWDNALHAILPGGLRTKPLWRVAPVAVAVATSQAHPRAAEDELDPEAFPEARRTLRLLRTHLWVSTFATRPSRLWPVIGDGAEPPPVVHPWPLRCQLAGHAAESDAAAHRLGGLSWDDVFEKLSIVDGVEPARCLYYQLAFDRFEDVVGTLVDRFTKDGHRDWVRLLDTVTGAPSRWPAVETAEQTLARLVPDEAPGRTPLWTAVANLTTLLWLYRDPLTMHTEERDELIRENFMRLHGNEAARADAGVLEEAAKQFERER